MKYSIIHINDRAVENIVHNKNILSAYEYVESIEYFDGIKNDGWEEMKKMGIPLHKWNPYDGRNTDPLPGEYGIWVSTIRALQHIVDNEIDMMLLLEDDITILDNFVENLDLCLNDLPSNFDFLSLFYHIEQNELDKNTNIGSEYIHKSKNQYSGGLAMIYSFQGAKRILSLLKRIGMEYTSDCFIYHYGQKDVLNGYSIQKNKLQFLINNDDEIQSLIDPKNVRHANK